jgi:hypothetical protein
MTICTAAVLRGAMRTGLLVLLAIVPVTMHAQTKALSLAEVIDLRQHGVSSRQILRNAREYCIAFSLSDSVRRELTVAGADTLLMGGLSNVCTTARPVIPPPTPIINDEFATSTTSQGFTWTNPRCHAAFETDGVRIENSGSDALCMVRYPSADLPSDVRLDFELTGLGATPGGSIVFGFGRQERSGNYYSLSIAANRRVELCWNAGRECNSLLSLAGAEPILTAPTAVNHLTVELRGREIALVVNGVNVGQYTADNDVRGRLMLGVGPQSNVVFVRLRATPLR